MQKELIKTLIIFAINVITILILANENIFSNTIAISTEYVTYNSLIAIVLFLVLIILRSNLKVALITNLSRLSFERVITLFAYLFFYTSFLMVFIYTQQLDFIIGIFLILAEIIFIISTLIISANSTPIYLNNHYVKLKEVIFTVLVVDLILKNQPFEFFAIPMDSILIAAYATICAYIVYKLISILKKSF